MSNRTLFKNARLLDARWDEPIENGALLIEGETIREVSDREIPAGDADVIDMVGRTVMPGLIDAHVHCVATSVNLGYNAALSHTTVALEAALHLRGMLYRGFTTVRDAGGADWALAQAAQSGLIEAPRLLIAGRALSQTGGHGDFRSRNTDVQNCVCGSSLGNIARLCDGVDAVRAAARDELRKGAHQLKVMASGGVASPTDPIESSQYSPEELRAIVAEAEAAKTYVMAHAYAPDAIARAVRSGVRTIEHGNLIDAKTAELVKAQDAYVVPTLVTYDSIAQQGRQLGFPQESIAKLEQVRQAGLRALEILQRAKVKMGFGTDLLGELHVEQNREFILRAEVLSPREIIASATTVNAEIINAKGKLGLLEAGACADLIGVDGDPLCDVSLLARPGEAIVLVIQHGQIVRCCLT